MAFIICSSKTCHGCFQITVTLKKNSRFYQSNIYFSSNLSFKACTTLGRNSCHQQWIQGAEAVRLQGQISCLLLLPVGLVSNNLWHTLHYHFACVARIAAGQSMFLTVCLLFLLQHICLPYWDHCIQRSCTWVSRHQYRGGRLLSGLPVHPSGLVRLLTQLHLHALRLNGWR